MAEPMDEVGGKMTAGKFRLAKTYIREITQEQADKDLDKFLALKCGHASEHSKAGLTFLDHYFIAYRYDTKSKRKITFYEFIKNKEILNKPYVKKMVQSELKRGVPEPYTYIHAFHLYYGTISQFRPTVAFDFYCKMKPTTVLDFSAGWGGRCLGAMKYGCGYIGVDTNTDLRDPYRKMLAHLKPKTKVQMIFRDSAKVDYSKYNYDMVFTSPPYYKKEVYEQMPEYSTYDEWIDTFLRPVVEKSYQHMKPGSFCLNVPQDIYQSLKKILGRSADKKYPLAISRRQKGVIHYKEYTYVWIKK